MMFKAIYFVVVFLFVFGFGFVFNRFLNDDLFAVPTVESVTPPVRYFGSAAANETKDESIRSFSVSVDESTLTDLKKRIQADLNRVLPAPIAEDFSYGFNSAFLKELLDYWIGGYDWKKTQKKVNSFPQFTTKIDGLNIHFIHVKGKKAAAAPAAAAVMLIHGWPGSFLEFLEVIPKLRDYDVIVPSLPGYGFSSGASIPGLNAAQTARIFAELMTRLGYSKFFVQGGDWGSFVAKNMAILYPERIMGVHINMITIQTPGALLKTLIASVFPKLILTDPEGEYWMVSNVAERFKMFIAESGYFHVHATKPDTVGIGLDSSPTALASWILEKVSVFTDPEAPKHHDGKLGKSSLSMDDLLSDVTLYWITKSATTSVRFYYETSGLGVDSERQRILERIPIFVPTGIAVYPKEVAHTPRGILENRFKNLVHYATMPKGGHFAAMEVPDLFSKDLIAFMTTVLSKKT